MNCLKILLIRVLLAAPLLSSAQTPKWNRLTLFAGMAYDKATTIYVDSKDNYYLGGQLQDYYGTTTKTNFQAGCIPLNALRKDGVDGFVVRYDKNYEITLRFAVPGRVAKLLADKHGNIYVVGVSEYDYSFDGVTLIMNSGITDGFLAKYDPYGKLIWYRVIKSRDSDVISGLDLDDKGNVLICGFSNDDQTFVFDRTIPAFSNFVVLCDEHANIKWVRVWSTKQAIRPIAVKFDLQENIVYTGGSATADLRPKVDVGKLSGVDGSVIWRKQWGGSGWEYTQQGTAVAIAQNGDYFVAGEFSGDGVFDSYSLVGKGYLDIYFARLDTAGNIRWIQTAGSTDFDKVYDIQSVGNEVFLCGGYSNNFSIGNQVLKAIDYTDIYVAATDGNGNLKWTMTGASSTKGERSNFAFHEYAAAIAIDSKNHIQVAGSTIGSGSFGKVEFESSLDANQNGFWATISPYEGDYKVKYPCKKANVEISYAAYPNPFTDQVKINIPVFASQTGANWKLYDAIGRLCQKGRFSGADLTIKKLNSLAKGVYILHIDGEIPISIKIVKGKAI